MPNPLEVLSGLQGLAPEARRIRWREGMEAWETLGNSEQALAWARLGGDAGVLARSEAAWAAERSRQQAILAANAAAARRRGPPTPPSLAWDEAGDLELGVTWGLWEGRPDLLLSFPEGPRRLPLSPFPQVAEGLRALASRGEPFLLCPSGGPALLACALEAQPALFLTMRPALYVVEPSMGVFRMMARLFDLSASLGADHVLWFAGPDWARRLAAFLRAHPGIPVPAVRAVLGGGEADAAAGRVLEEAMAWRAAEAGRLEAEARRVYAQRTDAGWADAFAEGARPRVLLVTSRFTTVLQHAARDLAQAFRALGCQAETLIERRDCAWSVMFEVRQRLAGSPPDLVVQLDHLRPEFGSAIAPEVPYACWVQDRLPNLLDPRWISRLGPRDMTFSMWPAMTRDLLAAGHPEVFPLPVAGNAFVYRPPTPPPAPGADVAFVSNIAVPAPLAAYPGLVESAERILRAGGIGYRDPAFYGGLLERLERELGLAVRSGDRPGVLQVLSFDVERWVQRTEPLRWARAMGLDLRVYGRGWELSEEFAPLWGGPVEPGEPLRDLYASARIHLHMNSDTNVHARVFECLLSGGFLMAWAHPSDGLAGGLGEALEIGREVETFSGRADFEAKVRRFLSGGALRREVSQAGRARALREHTTVHRAREILDRVRARLRAAAAGAPPGPAGR